MVIGSTLILALGAAAVGMFVYWILLKLFPGYVWICRTVGLAVALFIMATGPIVIGK